MDNLKRFKEILNRKQTIILDTNNSILELRKEIEVIDAKIFENLCNDIVDDDLELQLNLLKSNLDKLQNKADTVNSQEFDKNFVVANTELKELAGKIEADNIKTMQDLKLEHEDELKELLELKGKYLDAVKRIGSIVNNGDKLSKEINFVKRSLGSKTYYSNPLDDESILFISRDTINKAFKND